MSITKDLSVTITNEAEGTTLTLKTVSALGEDKVSIQGDPGVYEKEDLKKGLEEIEKFRMEDGSLETVRT